MSEQKLPEDNSPSHGAKAHGKRIIFAGGGTAGHVEPALAVAGRWSVFYPNSECIFIGTTSGLEATLVPQAGFDLKMIKKVVLPRKLNFDLLMLPFRLLKNVRAAREIVRGADLLIGFGGYVCATAYLAARFEGVPFLIHEANAKVGWANKIGALFTQNLAIAHSVSRGRFSKAHVTGLPLKQAVVERALESQSNWHEARLKAKNSLGWDENRPALLVLGGSQGSAYLNKQIAQILPALVAQGFQVLHSLGGKNALPPSSRNYSAISYIEDMATAYLAADIVIARSGAVTCAEFGALGRYAIFVPLPSGNGEQARNAEYLVSDGRAMLVSQKEFTSEWLIRNLPLALERSAKTSEGGLSHDLDSVENIISVMKDILESKSL